MAEPDSNLGCLEPRFICCSSSTPQRIHGNVFVLILSKSIIIQSEHLEEANFLEQLANVPKHVPSPVLPITMVVESQLIILGQGNGTETTKPPTGQGQGPGSCCHWSGKPAWSPCAHSICLVPCKRPSAACLPDTKSFPVKLLLKKISLEYEATLS